MMSKKESEVDGIVGRRKDIITDNEISEIYTFLLGGYEQKVLMEGKRADLPVVITLHGGPGTPIPFSVGCRGLFPVFTDNFIMVYWDQLGCGINNCVIDDSFHIEMFVRMTEELVEQIRKMFPDNRLLIFSTSWGSILSAKLLEKNPHAVDAVVACGQIIKNVFICDEVIDTLSKSGISRKKLQQVKDITLENVSDRDLQLISGSLRRYTNAYQNKAGKKAPVWPVIKGLMTSPDYSMKDLKAIVINGYMKNRSLWKEILKLDLTDQLKNVGIPYVILQGDTDIVASTKQVEALVAESHNPYLSCNVIADTGHLPGAEMMDALLSSLKEQSSRLC